MKFKTPRDVQRTFVIAKDALNQFLSAMADYKSEGDKAVLVDRFSFRDFSWWDRDEDPASTPENIRALFLAEYGYQRDDGTLAFSRFGQEYACSIVPKPNAEGDYWFEVVDYDGNKYHRKADGLDKFVALMNAAEAAQAA